MFPSLVHVLFRNSICSWRSSYKYNTRYHCTSRSYSVLRIIRRKALLVPMGSEKNELGRSEFRNRNLSDEDDVFKHNAWDNIEWNEEQEREARIAVKKNSEIKVSDDDISKYENEADAFWDLFYNVHQNRFFKDRHWLFTEFPELDPNFQNNEIENNRNMKFKIFEVGCGVGNTIIPILKRQIENVIVYGCDFSSKALEFLQKSPDFDEKRCEVFVMDASTENWLVPFSANSIDVIILIFVLSAIHPDKIQYVVKNCFNYLKPNGLLVLRDYGRYDLAQLRFKTGQCIQENFYVRRDGTRVYFFEQNEIKELFEKAGFIEEQNMVDRRLQVNRGRMLKMYRVWIQAKYRKPL